MIGLIKHFYGKIFGTRNERIVKRLLPTVQQINALEPEMQKLSDDELRAKTDQFRARMSADIRSFNTRPTFDARKWDDFVSRLHYTPGNFSDPAAYKRLENLTAQAALEAILSTNNLRLVKTPGTTWKRRDNTAEWPGDVVGITRK